jgi:hypothetical protein
LITPFCCSRTKLSPKTRLQNRSSAGFVARSKKQSLYARRQHATSASSDAPSDAASNFGGLTLVYREELRPQLVELSRVEPALEQRVPDPSELLELHIQLVGGLLGLSHAVRIHILIKHRVSPSTGRCTYCA